MRPFSGIGWDRGLLLPLVLAVLLLYGAVQNHLFNGQTDAFVLLLCVLFWIDWHEERGGRAAFWLGLAVSLKLVPALFFVPLVLRGSWSVLARTGFWILVLSVALPMLFLGTGVFSAYEHFARTVLLPELHTAAHSVRYPHCYTLHGALVSLVPAWKTSLAARAAAVLLVVVPLCVVGWRGGSSPWRRFARLEACLAGILLLAPLSQPHHLTLLLPGVLLMGLRWQTAPDRPLWAELLELLPFGLFPLWSVVGGPLESLALLWLFVAALGRATAVAGPSPRRPPLSRRTAGTGEGRLMAGAPQAEGVARTRASGRPDAVSPAGVS